MTPFIPNQMRVLTKWQPSGLSSEAHAEIQKVAFPRVSTWGRLQKGAAPHWRPTLE